MEVRVPIPLVLCDLKYDAENDASKCEVELQSFVYKMLADALHGKESSSLECDEEVAGYVKEALDACVNSYDTTIREEGGRCVLRTDWSRYASTVQRFEQ